MKTIAEVRADVALGETVLYVSKCAVSKLTRKGQDPVACSYTVRSSCAPSCPLRAVSQGGDGSCYAASGYYTRKAWDAAAGPRSMGWAEFCEAVANEPQGKLFRHNVAGDLPHNAGEIDAPKFLQLCDAVREAGLTGWTYTHHEPKGQNLHLMRYANAAGFTVNLSADSLTEADEFVKLECGPVCVTLPQGSAQVIKTPAGNTVRKCPAQVRDGITCAQCQWCALPSRGFIVGFEAHGTGARKLTQRLENENGGKL